jgi:hypothetical protein
MFVVAGAGFLAASILAGTAEGQRRFVSHMSGLQSVPANSTSTWLACEVVLETPNPPPDGGGLQMTIRPIFGDDLPEGTIFSFHKGAGPGETVAPFFSVPRSGGPGTWAMAIGVSQADIDLMIRNRWYFSATLPGAPEGPIRGQVKLANGTYNDYDGDGRTDVQVYRNSINTFFALRSTDGALIEQPLGQPGDSVSLTVDWDGDGLSDFSTARYAAEVVWRILPSTSGELEETQWGSSTLGDFFAAADYDGDGKFDIAVFRAGVWYIIESSTSTIRYDFWGTSGDVPAPNDFDGDGKADLAIARSVSGQRVWWIKNSSDGEINVYNWGLSSDAFFTGRADFDGDGKADLLVIRNEGGQRVYYIRRSSDGEMQVIHWGLSSDLVKLGDYDGDGITDPAVTRAVSGQRVFFILESSTGQPRYEWFGLQGDF